MASEIANPIITATAGLLGVCAGGLITWFIQKRERQRRFISEQLNEFYAPMVAMRDVARAKAEIRIKIDAAADKAWQQNVEDAKKYGRPDELVRMSQDRVPLFGKILEYNNHQAAEEIIPIYRRMCDLFLSKMHLAEHSTREHLPALTEFVDIWNRWLAKSIPGEVVGQLGHSEEKLYPLYEDLTVNFERLQQVRRKG
jgi:hypothetical protein